MWISTKFATKFATKFPEFSSRLSPTLSPALCRQGLMSNMCGTKCETKSPEALARLNPTLSRTLCPKGLMSIKCGTKCETKSPEASGPLSRTLHRTLRRIGRTSIKCATKLPERWGPLCRKLCRKLYRSELSSIKFAIKFAVKVLKSEVLMKSRHFILILILIFVGGRAVHGYMVGPPLTLDQLTAEADVIFKGTAGSSQVVQDPWFKPYPGFDVQETEFKVITLIKGDSPGDTIHFRHYNENSRPSTRWFEPQFYHLEPGQTYVVFAKYSDMPNGVCRQLWANHKAKTDQGLLWCADTNPVPAKPVKEILWSELMVMLKSPQPKGVTYAIRQLDEMSDPNGRFNKTRDFDCNQVLAAIHGLMMHPDAEIAQSAIGVVGSSNPYLSEEHAEYWLGTVGSAEQPGVGKMNPNMTNVGGALFWRDLVTIADDSRPASMRALIVRALGLVRVPALQESINHWVKDADASVRASATLLLADFPGSVKTTTQLTALADDGAPGVRSSVAYSIGFAQRAELASVLARLLADQEASVRRAAAMSLLSFSPRNEAVAAIFRANLKNDEFNPLFLNALAREKPDAYLDDLARVVENKTNPINWWGGQIPAFTAWKILFKALQAQPPDSVRSGKLDRYLDALEKVGNYALSEPRDIYAFYLQRGLVERARKYRQTATKSASYDLDRSFKQVDENPSLYIRE
jgi:hypothetical protein